MKKTIIVKMSLLSLLFNACSFNQSAEKDFVTGAYSRGDGIGSDEITMQVNGKPAIFRTRFVYGEKVNFIFNNVRGLKKEGNKVFPGLSMHIVKDEKDTVLAYPNLLDGLREGTELSPLQLQANFTAALPNKNNEKYKVHINIWDRKGEGTFSYELPFTVEESKLLNIDAKDISYSNIYLWNESLKQPVLDHEVSQKDTLILILEGLDGLEVQTGNVYPVFSIDITDHKGGQILSDPNVLREYEQEGINAENFAKSQLPVTITFAGGQINNPCKLTAVLKDKNTDKKLDITTELRIQ